MQPEYMTARQVWEMFSVTDRTLDRWIANSQLAFPRPTYLNRRKYFLRDEIEKWAASARSAAPTAEVA